MLESSAGHNKTQLMGLGEVGQFQVLPAMGYAKSPNKLANNIVKGGRTLRSPLKNNCMYVGKHRVVNKTRKHLAFRIDREDTRGFQKMHKTPQYSCSARITEFPNELKQTSSTNSTRRKQVAHICSTKVCCNGYAGGIVQVSLHFR